MINLNLINSNKALAGLIGSLPTWYIMHGHIISNMGRRGCGHLLALYLALDVRICHFWLWAWAGRSNVRTCTSPKIQVCLKKIVANSMQRSTIVAAAASRSQGICSIFRVCVGRAYFQMFHFKCSCCQMGVCVFSPKKSSPGKPEFMPETNASDFQAI